MPNNTSRSCSVWSRKDICYNNENVKVSYNIPSFPASRVKVIANASLKRIEVTLLAFKTKNKVTKFFFAPQSKSQYDFGNIKAQVRFGVLTVTIPKAVPSTMEVKVAK